MREDIFKILIIRNKITKWHIVQVDIGRSNSSKLLYRSPDLRFETCVFAFVFCVINSSGEVHGDQSRIVGDPGYFQVGIVYRVVEITYVF